MPPDSAAASRPLTLGTAGHIDHGKTALIRALTGIETDPLLPHLLQYDPETDAWHDRGAVIEQLQAAGLYHQGEGQIKIHSKELAANYSAEFEKMFTQHKFGPTKPKGVPNPRLDPRASFVLAGILSLVGLAMAIHIIML